MAQLSEFERSYSHVLLFPPQPIAMLEYEGRQGNVTAKMYGFYLQEKRMQVSARSPVDQSFLVWHRSRQYDNVTGTVSFRGGKHQQMRAPTLVVACRYWYELTDGFGGQFLLTQFTDRLTIAPEAAIPCQLIFNPRRIAYRVLR